MKVQRAYVHKTHGDIGAVELDVGDTLWALDGKELPEESMRHLATFALQSLQDAYAGSKNAEDAAAAFGTKYAKLLSGEIGTRGTGVDTFTKECRSVARELIRHTFRKAGKPYKEFTEKPTEDQLKSVETVINDNRKLIEKEATKRIDARDKVKDLDIDIKI